MHRWPRCRREWREWLAEKPAENPSIDDPNQWVNKAQYGFFYRKVNGEFVTARKARSGYWYAVRGGELLGQAGRPQCFSSSTEACTAVDLFAVGANGWEWVAGDPPG